MSKMTEHLTFFYYKIMVWCSDLQKAASGLSTISRLFQAEKVIPQIQWPSLVTANEGERALTFLLFSLPPKKKPMEVQKEQYKSSLLPAQGNDLLLAVICMWILPSAVILLVLLGRKYSTMSSVVPQFRVTSKTRAIIDEVAQRLMEMRYRCSPLLWSFFFFLSEPSPGKREISLWGQPYCSGYDVPH